MEFSIEMMLTICFTIVVIGYFHAVNHYSIKINLCAVLIGIIIAGLIMSAPWVMKSVWSKDLAGEPLYDVCSVVWYVTTVYSCGISFLNYYYLPRTIKRELYKQPLSRYHINKIENYLVEHDNTYRNKHRPNKDLKIDSFLNQNQVNLATCIKLKNRDQEQKHKILAKIYEQFYFGFSDNFLMNIYRLQIEKRQLPEKVALVLRKEFNEAFDVQLNTCQYSFKEFRNLSSENLVIEDSKTIQKQADKVSERIFLINKEEDLNIQCEDYQWVVKWHEENQTKILFVLREDAEKEIEKHNQFKVNKIIDSLDFSINYNYGNEEEKLVLVNHELTSTAEQMNVGIVKDKILSFQIEITNTNTYYEYFTTLKNKQVNMVTPPCA